MQLSRKARESGTGSSRLPGMPIMDVFASATVFTDKRNAASDRGGTMASHALSPVAATAGALWRWAAIRRRLYGNR